MEMYIYYRIELKFVCATGSIPVHSKIIRAFNNWASEAENDLHGKWIGFIHMLSSHLSENSIDIGDFPQAIEKFQKQINNGTTRTHAHTHILL